jgi:F0F1-type ATP synthase assembly protein I
MAAGTAKSKPLNESVSGVGRSASCDSEVLVALLCVTLTAGMLDDPAIKSHPLNRASRLIMGMVVVFNGIIGRETSKRYK